MGEEFAGSTFSSDGKVLFVNIQASVGDHVRDLGPVAEGGALSPRAHSSPAFASSQRAVSA